MLISISIAIIYCHIYYEVSKDTFSLFKWYLTFPPESGCSVILIPLSVTSKIHAGGLAVDVS